MRDATLKSVWRMAWLAGLLSAGAVGAGESRLPQSSRDFYNEGTQRLRDGKLREAEAALQTAVGGNDLKVQPTALYNLGEVRFRQGAEALKDAPNASAAKTRADAASNLGDKAIRDADAALAGDDLEAITRAYLQGRGTRRELKAALAAVKKAMEAHGAVLARWQRASGDFKSAGELRPAFDDALFNAKVVDRRIARLVDQQEMMKMAAQCAGGKRKDLKDRMDELKKRMPEGQQPQDDGEDDDDDDDQDKPPKQPKQGHEEKETKDGKEMTLTWEEAMRLLEALKLDANRKLPMGDQDTAKPKDRKGKDW
jgi:hypothetical protein